ncbi:MAG TPA: UbiA family prenyltransferase [Candidatus Latescibacteria bacterium]|nr:UbiA family prenyltransferase [Candidatus Latescibacterota bacterium]HQE61501.1 UbiA family prenyltransferase [Candidatus Latescibacterota bacterium]HQK23438.1 UbiA family prenyltransferase [Candidatus Latescibacterota bacterium]
MSSTSLSETIGVAREDRAEKHEIRPRWTRYARTPLALAADLLFLTRPVLLGPVWVVYGAGAVLVGSSPGIDLLFVSFVVAGVYIHNQLTDIPNDRANRKLFLLSDGHVSHRAALTLTAMLWSAGILWSATQGIRSVLFALAIVLGLLYNGLRQPGWKSRPLLGLVANALAHGVITFVAGFTAAGGTIFEGIVRSIPYAFAVAAVYLATTIVDENGDRLTNKRTFCVVYGRAACTRWIAGLVCAAAVTAAANGDGWMAAAAIVSLVPAFLLLRAPAVGNAQRAAVIAVSVLALAVAVRWTTLFVLAAATFAATRYYYRLRFGVVYPTLGSG